MIDYRGGGGGCANEPVSALFLPRTETPQFRTSTSTANFDKMKLRVYRSTWGMVDDADGNLAGVSTMHPVDMTILLFRTKFIQLKIFHIRIRR